MSSKILLLASPVSLFLLPVATTALSSFVSLWSVELLFPINWLTLNVAHFSSVFLYVEYFTFESVVVGSLSGDTSDYFLFAVV